MQSEQVLLNLKKDKTVVVLFVTAQRLKLHGCSLNVMYNNAVMNVLTEYVYIGNLANNHMTLTSNFERAYKRERWAATLIT